MKKLIALIVMVLMLIGCGKSSISWQEQYDLGVKYLSEGNYEKALEMFEFVISVEPKYIPAYEGHADAIIHIVSDLNAVDPENEKIKEYIQELIRDYDEIVELKPDYVSPELPPEIEWLIIDILELTPQDENTDTPNHPEAPAWFRPEQIPLTITPEVRLANVVGRWDYVIEEYGIIYSMIFSEDGQMETVTGYIRSDAAEIYRGSYTLEEPLGDGSAILNAVLTGGILVWEEQGQTIPNMQTINVMLMLSMQDGKLQAELLSNTPFICLDQIGSTQLFTRDTAYQTAAAGEANPQETITEEIAQETTPEEITQETAIQLAEIYSGIQDGETDPDTGNQYVFGCYEDIVVNGEAYWNVVVSWLVNAPEGGHLSRIGNLYVHKTTGQIIQPNY